MRDIRVSDITMREAIASKALSLSFKEKLEIVNDYLQDEQEQREAISMEPMVKTPVCSH